MPDLHEANAILPHPQRFHDAVYAVPWQAEDDFHPPIDDCFDQDVSRGFCHAPAPRNARISVH
jgi:hypothetical protein